MHRHISQKLSTKYLILNGYYRLKILFLNANPLNKLLPKPLILSIAIRHTSPDMQIISWNDEYEKALFTALSRTPARFILSTWHQNNFRRNEYIELFQFLTREHFYHASESNRNLRRLLQIAILRNIESVNHLCCLIKCKPIIKWA